MRNTAITHIKPGEKLDGREVREVKHVRNEDFLVPGGFDSGTNYVGVIHYADGGVDGPVRLSRRVMVEEA